MSIWEFRQWVEGQLPAWVLFIPLGVAVFGVGAVFLHSHFKKPLWEELEENWQKEKDRIRRDLPKTHNSR